jgi:NACalpha-BTF3-like transcription factor
MGMNQTRAPETEMTTPTTFVTTQADIDRVVRQARAARAEIIRASAHDLTAAIKRLFAALRPQAAH